MTQTSYFPTEVPSAETRERRSNVQVRNKKKRLPSTVTNASHFVGKCVYLREHIYDVGGGRGGSDTFVKTTWEIVEYVSGNLKEASEFSNAMDPDVLSFDAFEPHPMLQVNAGVMEVEIWKIGYKNYNDALKRRELLVGQVFAVVLGQLSSTIVNWLKANTGKKTVVSPGTRIFNPESNRLIETYSLSNPESQSSNTHGNAKQCHQNKHGIQKPNLV
jgi:hypothetical protein